MSSNIILKPHTFFSAVSASAVSPWVPLDCNYSGTQDRSISGFRTSVNCPIQILVKTVVPTFLANGNKTTSVEVTATVTTFVSGNGTYISTGISLPATHIQVIKVTSSGAATVVGMI
jgi:hypothetical protein